MGSGSRIKFSSSTDGVSFGVFITTAPFAYTFGFAFLFWTCEIGLGKAYDA